MIMRNRFADEVSFLDVVTCMALFFLVFSVICLLNINPKVKVAEQSIKAKAEFVIRVTWPHENNCDVDVHFKDAMDSYVWFQQKQDGLLHLDRDDYGNSNDTVIGADGNKIVFEHNEEIVTIRGIVPGECRLNLHLYSYQGLGILASGQKEIPTVEVTVEIIKLNPKRITKWKKKFTLDEVGQELHLTRFTLTEKGNIENFDDSSPVYFTSRAALGWQNGE